MNLEVMRDYEQKLRRINREYSYYEIKVPLFTNEAIYKHSNLTKELYKINHKREAYALRADFSTAILDQVVNNDEQIPTKRAYYGEVFRMNRSDMWQIGIEYIGEKGIESEKEIIKIIDDYLDVFPDEEYVLCINYMPFVDSVIKLLKLSDKKARQFKSNLAKHNYVSIKEELRESLDNQKYEMVWQLFSERDILVAIKLVKEIFVNEEYDSLLVSFLESLSSKYTFDLGLVRNLNYYTGIVFEIYARNSPTPIITGGRYDKLANQFGKDLSAIGLAVDATWLGGERNVINNSHTNR